MPAPNRLAGPKCRGERLAPWVWWARETRWRGRSVPLGGGSLAAGTGREETPHPMLHDLPSLFLRFAKGCGASNKKEKAGTAFPPRERTLSRKTGIDLGNGSK